MKKQTIKTKKAVFFLLSALIAAAVIIFVIFNVKKADNLFQRQIYPQKYSEYVSAYSKEYNVDEAFVYAIIKCESNFTPDAVSSIGARGLMQLTEDTFDWVKFKLSDDDSINYDMMFDPEVNIKYGVFLISMLTNEFKNETNTLCAYHAGRGITNKWLINAEYSSDGVIVDNIPYADTSSYVLKVLKTFDIYKTIYYSNH